MSIRHSYKSTVYRDFCAIDLHDPHRIILFFEGHESEIEALEDVAYFEVLTGYAQALYEVGHAHKYLLVAQTLLEWSIVNNQQYCAGKDVYLHTLYQRAEVLFRLDRNEEAAHVAGQLLNLAPTEGLYIRLLRRIEYARQPLWVRRCFAIGMIFYFAFVASIVLDILLLNPLRYFPLSWQYLFNSGLFGGGVCVMFGGFLLHRQRVRRAVAKRQTAAIQKLANAH